jgi:hypothetical protein
VAGSGRKRVLRAKPNRAERVMEPVINMVDWGLRGRQCCIAATGKRRAHFKQTLKLTGFLKRVYWKLKK